MITFSNLTKSDKAVIKVVILVITIVLFSSCQVEEMSVYNSQPATNSKFETSLLDGLNNYRNSEGLPSLETDKFTTELAKEHNSFMILSKEVSHTNFENRNAQLLNKGALSIGENVAYGYKSIDQVISSWCESESHHKVIIGNYTHIGISIQKNYYTTIYIRL